MESRDVAIVVGRARMAIGAAALLLPGLAGRVLAGRDGSRPGMKLLARMVGARDAGLGLGVVIALDRGAPVRGWLEASALADGADLAALLLARDHVPRGSLPASMVLAAGGAALNAWLSRELDPPPPADPGHVEAAATGHPPERAPSGSRAG